LTLASSQLLLSKVKNRILTSVTDFYITTRSGVGKDFTPGRLYSSTLVLLWFSNTQS